MADTQIDMEDLFSKFLVAYKKANVIIKGQEAQIKCSIIWRALKKGKDDISIKSEAENLMQQWEVDANKPSKGSILSLWSKQPSKKKSKLAHFYRGVGFRDSGISQFFFRDSGI